MRIMKFNDLEFLYSHKGFAEHSVAGRREITPRKSESRDWANVIR